MADQAAPPAYRSITSPSPRTTKVQRVSPTGGGSVAQMGFAPLSVESQLSEGSAAPQTSLSPDHNPSVVRSLAFHSRSRSRGALEPLGSGLTSLASMSRQMSGQSPSPGPQLSIRFPGGASPVPTQKKEYCLDDFEMIKKLGQGAFGKVVMVRKKDSGNIYAMKCVSKSRAMQSGTIQEALLEMKVLQQVHTHPFVVSMRYAFQTEDALFIVLDFAGGGDTLQLLKEKRSFPEDWVVFYAAEVLLAMDYMHQQDIIYRDLKPENVLLTTEGHTLLADFGLSKPEVQGMSLTHTFCGTPHYASPEMIQRTGHSKMVDFWALGVAIYEWSVGKPPWRGDDVSKIFQQILSGKPKFPTEMSRACCDIIERLLERDPKKRLGYNGVSEIKNHPFFKSIDWDALFKKEMKPPFHPSDITQGLPEKKKPGKKILNIQKHIPGFHFVNPDSPMMGPKPSPEGLFVHERSNSIGDVLPIYENFELGSQEDIRHHRLNNKDLNFLKMIEDLTLFTEVRVNGTVVYDSPPMCQLLGLPDSIHRVGEDMQACIHPDDRPAFINALNDMRQYGKDAPRNTCVSRVKKARSGAEEYVHLQFKFKCAIDSAAMWDGNDESAQVYLMAEDVSCQETAKELARLEIEEIYGKRKFDMIPQVLAEGVALPAAPDSESESGRFEYRRRLTMLFNAFPDFKVNVMSMTGHDDKVLAKWKFTGHHQAAYRGINGSGKKVVCHGMNIYKVDKDKIVDIMMHIDNQLIVQPEPGVPTLERVSSTGGVEGTPLASPLAIQSDNTMRNQAKWFMEAMFNQRGIDKVRMMCNQNVEISDSVFQGTWRGTYDLRVILERYWKAFPDLNVSIDEAITKEMKVVLRWSALGTHSGTFSDVEATKRKVTLTGISILEFDDEMLIRRFTINVDIMGFLKQLGIAFAQGQNKNRKVSESGEPFSPTVERGITEGRLTPSNQNRVDIAKNLLAETKGMMEKTQKLATIMCDWFDFLGAVMWVPSHEYAGVKAFEAATFHVEKGAPTNMKVFVEKCSDFVLDAQGSLAGQVRASKLPVWLNEIVALTPLQYPMVKVARKYQMKSGVMFPLFGGDGRVAVVMEMFTDRVCDKNYECVDFALRISKGVQVTSKV